MTRVYHAHVDAGFFQRECGEVSVVIVGEDHAAGAGGNGVSFEQPAHGRSHGDAGTVVVGKGDGAFKGTCGEDDMTCADFPKPMTRCACCEE